MTLLDSFGEGLRSIAVNKLRSGLTMLGVVIGVAAVIAMVAVGNGASARVQQTVLSLGSNLITVTPQALTQNTLRGAGATSASLTLDDMEALETQLGDSIAAIQAEQQAGRWQLTAGGTNWNSSVTGATEQYPVVRDWQLASGSFFDETHIATNALVAVIGWDTALNLFGENDPVGQTVQLRQAAGFAGGAQTRARILTFKVIGVLAPKGTTFGVSRDDIVVVPTTTSQRVLTGRTDSVNSIVIKATSNGTMAETTELVRDILYVRHEIDDVESADFQVQNQDDTLAALGSITATFTILLGAIGGISLLVGGIGIMNIMLVSVHERTREIGIRKAVGARRRDILSQFLIEAVTLTGTGGALGILLGWAITKVVERVEAGLLVLVTPESVIVAVGVSVAIGVVFGMYPAMRAARLHPIEALRYE